jgi:hypothetical protein
MRRPIFLGGDNFTVGLGLTWDFLLAKKEKYGRTHAFNK